MNKNPRVLLFVGIALLLVGAIMNFGFGGGTGADAAQEQACRAEMEKRGPEGKAMADQCSDANFAIATTATDASSAAAAISANNQAEIGGSSLGLFLLGMGLVLTLAGIILPIIRKKS